MGRKKWFCGIVAVLLLAAVNASAFDYRDRDYQRWLELYQAEAFDELKRDIVEHVTDSDLHPLAYLVLFRAREAHALNGNSGSSTDVDEAVKSLTEIEAFIEAYDVVGLQSAFPPDHPYFRRDPYALWRVSEFVSEFSLEAMLGYSEVGLQQFPGYFLFVNQVLESNRRELGPQIQAIADRCQGCDPAAVSLLEMKAADPLAMEFITLAGRKSIVFSWLDSHPADITAMQVSAVLHEQTYWNPRADKIASWVFGAMPFVDWPSVYVYMRAPLRGGYAGTPEVIGEELDRRISEVRLALAVPTSSHDSLKALSYRTSGDLGSAAGVLAEAGRSSPLAQKELARLARAERRPEEVELRSVVSYEDLHGSFDSGLDYADALLRFERTSEAKRELDRLRLTVPRVNSRYVVLLATYFEKERNLRQLRSLAEEFPESIAPLVSTRSLIEPTNRFARSDLLEVAREVYERRGLPSDTKELLAAIDQSGMGLSERADLIEQLIARDTRNMALREAHLELIREGSPSVSAYWASIKDADPVWAAARVKWIRSFEDNWERQLEETRLFLEETREDPESYAFTQAWWEHCWALESALANGASVLDEFNRHTAEDQAGAYLLGRDKILESRYARSLPDTSSPGKAMQQAALTELAELMRDGGNFERGHIGLALVKLDPQLAFAYLYRHLQRRPGDPVAYENYMEVHARWGGSPVAVVWAYEQASRRSLVVSDSYYNDALSAFGDAESALSNYRGDFRIGNSLRYIDWYEAALGEAHKSGSSRVVLLDAPGNAVTATARIAFGDGEVFERSDDLRTARVVALKQGATQLRLEWGGGTRLSKVLLNGRPLISYRYAEGKIEFLRLEDRQLQIEFYESGRPASLDVVYKSGESLVLTMSEDLTAWTIDGKPATASEAFPIFDRETRGVKKALRLSESRFNRFPSLESFGSTDWNLLISDLERARLRFGDDVAAASDQDWSDYLSVLQRLAEAGYIHARAPWQALQQLTSLINDGTLQDDPSEALVYGVGRSLVMWKSLMLRRHATGVPRKDLFWFYKAMDWYSRYLDVGDASQYFVELRATDAPVLEAERWLSGSRLGEPSRWDSFVSGLGAAPKVSAQINSPYPSEEVVVGSEAGLSLWRESGWQHLALDAGSQAWRNVIAPKPSQASRGRVTSLARGVDNRLWVGTQGGLVVLDASTPSTARWIKIGGGSQYVTALARFGNGVLAMTRDAVYRIPDVSSDAVLLPELASVAGASKVLIPGRHEGEQILKNTRALFLHDDEVKLWAAGRLEAFDAGDAVLDMAVAVNGGRGELVLLTRRQVLAGRLTEAGAEGFAPIAGYSALPGGTRARSLQRVYSPDLDEPMTAIITDTGVGFYRGTHTEFLDLRPHQAGRPLTVIGENADQLNILTSNMQLECCDSRVQARFPGGVSQFLYVESWGLMLAAGARGLSVVSDGVQPQSQRSIYSGRAGHMVTADGGVYFSTPSALYFLQTPESDAEQLFEYADHQPEFPSNWTNEGRVTGMAHHEGRLWVTRDSVLYIHDRERQDTRTLDAINNPDAFPVSSDKLGGVFVGPEDTLLVVASDESHRRVGGKKLHGGLYTLKKDGAFKAVDLDQVFSGAMPGSSWYVTGLTPIDDEQSWVTTLNFPLLMYKDSNQNLGVGFDSAVFGSMVELKIDQRNTLVTTSGSPARFGERLWLFPTESGVVGKLDGEMWIFDSINRLLPGFGDGSNQATRGVTSLAVDPSGTVFVGNRQGAISVHFDSLEDLLLAEGRGAKVIDQVFASDEKVLDAELVASLPKGSKASEAAARFKTLSGPAAKGDGDQAQERKRQAALNRFISQLEPSLRELLHVEATELSSIRRGIGGDQAILQFLPLEDKLIIKVSRATGADVLRTVRVSRKALFETARTTAQLMEGQASAIASGAAHLESAELTDALQQLYQWLLAPVIPVAADVNHFFVVPAGPLAYVPFPALLKDASPARYAVEDHGFSVINSAYQLDIVNRARTLPPGNTAALLVGDPDGSLPYARNEVRDVAGVVSESQVLLAEEATKSALDASLPSMNILHLATHGVLDASQPTGSYLVLGGGDRLTIPDVLALDGTDKRLAVLSACETARGADGQEYRTLSRAFTHAGFRNVVGTLWSVDDRSMGRGVLLFYDYLSSGMDEAEALRQAQVDMLSMPEPYNRPGAWGALVLFGG